MKRVLYIEDNEDNAFMLQMRLELEGGYDLKIAINGTDGLAMAKQLKPELILMDVNLPDIDGLEVTRCIKTDPEIANIPVIALTSNAMSGDRETALAAGCDEFDTKPVDFDRLLKLMAGFLG